MAGTRSLEVADTILDLNENWPLGTDQLTQGDDHIRLLKTVLQAAYPIGSVLYNTTGTNPGTYIGGTWAATSQGRAIVGVGDNGEFDWQAGEERGAETHTLSGTEMPSHSHKVDPPNTNTATHNEDYSFTIRDVSSGNSLLSEASNVGLANDGTFANSVDIGSSLAQTKATWNIDHSHAVNIPEFDSATQGGGGPHNNIQPSLAVYVWERTA